MMLEDAACSSVNKNKDFGSVAPSSAINHSSAAQLMKYQNFGSELEPLRQEECSGVD